MGDGDETRAHVRGSALLLTGQVFGGVVGLVVQVFLVRHLSKGDYGAFAYALSIAGLASAPVSLGLSRGVRRFVPLFEARGERDKAVGVIAFSFLTVTIAGAVVVVLVVLLRDVIGGSDDGRAEMVAALIVLAPVNALSTLLDGTFAIFERPAAIVLNQHIIVPIGRLLVVFALIATGGGALFAAIGYAATGVGAVVIFAVVLRRLLRQRGLTTVVTRVGFRVPIRELLRYSIPLLTNDASALALGAAGTVLLGAMAGNEEVAVLRSVMPIALTMQYVLSSFVFLFVPTATRLYATGDSRGVDRLYWRTAAWTATLTFPMLLLTAPLAGELIRALFGPGYSDAAPVLAVLAAGTFITAAAGPNSAVLQVYARVRFLVWTNVLSVALNVALNVVLIPELHAFGVAIATLVTQVALNTAWQIGIARTTDVRWFNLELLPLYASFAGTAVTVAAVNVLLDPPILVGIGMVALVSGGALLTARRRLRLLETFPEIGRLRWSARRRALAPEGPVDHNGHNGGTIDQTLPARDDP